MKKMLLKNGTVLSHDSDGHVIASLKDILIENRKIARIGPCFEASHGLEVLDCTDKLISLGFVDTRHHGW